MKGPTARTAALLWTMTTVACAAPPANTRQATAPTTPRPDAQLPLPAHPNRPGSPRGTVVDVQDEVMPGMVHPPAREVDPAMVVPAPADGGATPGGGSRQR